MRDKTTWNKVREELIETLLAYESIIDVDEYDEFRHLGNDIISIIRDVYYNKKVEA